MLDRVYSPEYRCRLPFHVDNTSIQHRHLHNTLLLLEGVYHYNWLAHIPVAHRDRGANHRWAQEASIRTTFVSHPLTSQLSPLDSAPPYSYPLVYAAAVNTFLLAINWASWAYLMLLQVLPLSIARYRKFAHHNVPNAVTIFVDIIYLSNGLFNVLLFSITRPFLLPHDLPSPDIELASPVVGPAGIEELNEAADNEIPAVRLESPVPDRYSRPESDLVDNGILGWSPEGVAFVTNAQSRSTISVGL